MFKAKTTFRKILYYSAMLIFVNFIVQFIYFNYVTDFSFERFTDTKSFKAYLNDKFLKKEANNIIPLIEKAGGKCSKFTNDKFDEHFAISKIGYSCSYEGVSSATLRPFTNTKLFFYVPYMTILYAALARDYKVYLYLDNQNHINSISAYIFPKELW